VGGGAASAVLVRCGRDIRSMDFRPELPPPQPSPAKTREERERERRVASVDMIRTSENAELESFPLTLHREALQFSFICRIFLRKAGVRLSGKCRKLLAETITR
jgi:hypothetical protein